MNCKLVANDEIYQGTTFTDIDFCIWPPGGSDMSKDWKKIIISLFLFIIYIHNELQYCSKS